MKSIDAETQSIPVADVVQNIISLNARLSAFWSSAHGWAPEDAANLLGKSRLDWQVSLSETLHIWVDKDTMSEGELILAWTNLGALLEGTLKLFFSIYYLDFQADVEALKKANAFDKKKNTHKEPDRLTLEVLRGYALHKKLFQRSQLDLILLIQIRRNAIHAFKHRELGNVGEFRKSVHGYMDFLQHIDQSVPYPDYHTEDH